MPWLLGTILVFAPLFRAGQEPVPLLTLQLLAVLVFLLSLWTPAASHRLRKPEIIVLALLFLFPLLFIIPVPSLPLDWLPGRDKYLEALALSGQDQLMWAPTLSIYPLETESAWLTLLIPVAVFVATRKLARPHLDQLILLVMAIAGIQAALGLMQFGGGPESPLYLGSPYAQFGSGMGTYTNRNHLAGLIELVLPVTLALSLYSLGRNERRDPRSWRARILFLSTLRGHAAFLYGALALLLLLGMIFTRSRTGISLTILAVLAVTFSFGRRIGGNNVYGPIGTIVTFVVGIGIAIGLAPVLDRFASADLQEDSRWIVFSATVDGILDFFPLGSGPGTYPDVFHAFQPTELGDFFVNHAHNDYLEWLFEGGVFVALLIALLLGLYVVQWGKVWTKEAWSRFRFLQVGAGIGIFLLLLHEFVDYNLLIPANMVYFAFLAGIFFSDPDQRAVSSRGHGRERPLPDSMPTTSPGGPVVKPMEPASDQIKNPFLD
ncbi:O-antigen ligase family protein [Candidatus Thiosymbion oneisti]|uniref:O-antigen ligase family protein n=1 Tax=Candidatus Thiosymbion oneisti TaxID=589554 RepID=UPI0015B5DFF9|nr:O-antigen ligase family protein [Candidatus Thiosymbion oneisti]